MNHTVPRFEAVMFDYCEDVLKMFVGVRLINKVFGRVVQSHALGRMMIQHFDAAAGIGERPTLTRLQNDIGHARTLAAFFGLLRVTGLVVTESSPGDRRVKYLVPTARANQGLRVWLLPKLKSCERMGMIETGFTDKLAASDKLFTSYVRQSIYILDNVNRQFPQFPMINRLHTFDCGDRIAFFLLREHYRVVLSNTSAQADELLWFKFSSSLVAAKLGVSKSHVRNVINEAEQLAAIRHDDVRHHVALEQRFVNEAHDWLMNTLMLFAETAKRAALSK
jgi:hypothetical protein